MKHVLRVACAGAWLLAITASVYAQSTSEWRACRAASTPRRRASSDILYHQASQWLLGYVSGMNAAMKVAKGTTPLANLTNDQVLKSAGDYCEANPASNLANAANEWYATLPKQTDPQAAQKDPQDNSLTLSLDRAPKIKPLLDRR